MSDLEKSREANESYHAKGGVSSSQVAAFISDPVSWYRVYVAKDWPKPPPTPAMTFGTAVHEMCEMGGPSKIGIVKVPRSVLNKDGHRKGKAWTDFRAEHSGATQFVNDGDRSPLHEIWHNLNANDHCREFLKQPKKEVEFFWKDEDSGLELKAKLDVLSDYPALCIVDWKTSRTVDARGFAIECYSRSYDVRLALYRRGVRKITGVEDVPIVAAVIENSGSYRVKVYQMDDEWIDKADERLTEILRRMRGFVIDDELNSGIVEISAPRWAYCQSEYEV